MSSDDFLDDLKGAWQSRETDLGDIAARVADGERQIRKEKAGRLGSIVVCSGACLFFVYLNWVKGDPAFHLAAVAFLVAGLLAIGDFVFLRRSKGSELLEAPEDVLAEAERQAMIALRLLEAKLAYAVLLLVCAIILAVFVLAKMTSTWNGLFISVIWAAGAVGGFLYYRRKKNTADGELREVRSLRADFRGEG